MPEFPLAWDAYREGMRFTWKLRVSDQDMAQFAQLSGDYNPIHRDAGFALSKGFKAPVVYGVLLSVQMSRLIGEELPDRHAMLTGISIDFVKPAFVGEELDFHAELITRSESTGVLEFKCRIQNDAVTLCRGKVSAIWRA